MKLPFSLPTDNYILIGGIILIVALAFAVTFFMSKRSAAIGTEVAASRESGQSIEGQAPPMHMQQEYSQDQLDPVTGPREQYD